MKLKEKFSTFRAYTQEKFQKLDKKIEDNCQHGWLLMFFVAPPWELVFSMSHGVEVTVLTLRIIGLVVQMYLLYRLTKRHKA